MIPIQPEPTASLRARFPEAVNTVVSAFEVSLFPERAPGNKRRHVFDFETGARLLISIDDDNTGDPPVLHVSSSLCNPNCPDAKKLREMVTHIENLVAACAQLTLERLKELTETPLHQPEKCQHLAVTSGGILHMFFKAEPFIELGLTV